MSTNLSIIIWLVFIALLSAHVDAHIARERRQVIITRGKELSALVDEEIKIEKLQKRPTLEKYLAERQKLIENEYSVGFESDVELNDREKLANEVIKAAKAKEVDEGLKDPYRFKPARHLFEVLKDIRKSELFQIIQKMPKGGILHAHDTALCSTDYIITLTYLENLWQCSELNTKHRIKEFIFSLDEPSLKEGCEWKSVADVRKEIGAAKYDRLLRSLFTLYREDQNPRTQFKDINDVWNNFMDIFTLLGPIVTYAPVWKDYYTTALAEMYADGVQYLEFRGLLPPVNCRLFIIIIVIINIVITMIIKAIINYILLFSLS